MSPQERAREVAGDIAACINWDEGWDSGERHKFQSAVEERLAREFASIEAQTAREGS